MVVDRLPVRRRPQHPSDPEIGIVFSHAPILHQSPDQDLFVSPHCERSKGGDEGE
jgi:hypothetical protein